MLAANDKQVASPKQEAADGELTDEATHLRPLAHYLKGCGPRFERFSGGHHRLLRRHRRHLRWRGLRHPRRR